MRDSLCRIAFDMRGLNHHKPIGTGELPDGLVCVSSSCEQECAEMRISFRFSKSVPYVLKMQDGDVHDPNLQDVQAPGLLPRLPYPD